MQYNHHSQHLTNNQPTKPNAHRTQPKHRDCHMFFFLSHVFFCQMFFFLSHAFFCQMYFSVRCFFSITCFFLKTCIFPVICFIFIFLLLFSSVIHGQKSANFWVLRTFSNGNQCIELQKALVFLRTWYRRKEENH